MELLAKETELRDKIEKYFKRKLQNIETKYKSIAQQNYDCNQMKQQILQLSTELHKYKLLYDASRRGLAEFLALSSKEMKNLEEKIRGIETGHNDMKVELDNCKMQLYNRETRLNELMLVVEKQAQVF